MRLVYLVHNLADPTVARRVRLLQAVGGDVQIAGFARGAPYTSAIEGVIPLGLGVTRDSRLVTRVLSVVGACLGAWRWRRMVAGADVVMARQLEMAVIALAAMVGMRRRPALVFECLDIHRLMIRRDIVGACLRAIERAVLKRSALLVLSSPGFASNYFDVYQRARPPIALLENRLVFSEVTQLSAAPLPNVGAEKGGPPWKIGWFGMIRCERSLRLLADLTRSSGGSIEVIIAGTVTPDLRPMFDAVISGEASMAYAGPYDRARDLRRLYASVHFTWAIDFYEAGANSDWLLPNRLYEGGYCRSVMIAAGGTETARWLERRGLGVVIEEPFAAQLAAMFAALSSSTYQAVKAAADAAPEDLFVQSPKDAQMFGDILASLNAAPGTNGRLSERAAQSRRSIRRPRR